MADTSALDSDDVSLSSQHTPSVPSRPSPAPRLQFLFGDQSPSADEQQASTSRSISPGRASRTLQNSCNQIENLQRALGTTNTGTLTPRTPPLPTLKALYPPDVLLANRAIKTDEDGECTSNDTRKKWFHILEPFKNKKKKEAKDFASVVNPTAPRIAAPQPAAAKSLPPPTVRGPKGVSHPNLNEQLRSVERLRVQKNQISSSSDLPPTPGTSKTESFAGTVRKTSETASEQSCVIPERAPVNEYIESNINQNTSSRQDAYADLVQNLARDEEKAQPQFSSMPVHETAFLPQRGAQLPWQPAVAGGRSAIGARDSEGYTTTDDEFDNVPLRRTASSRHYDSDRVKYVDRTRSLSPPPVLVTHITNRGSLPIMGQVDPRQLLMYQNNVLPNQWSPYGYIMQTSPRNNYPPQQPCTSQVTYAPHVTCSSPLPQQVLPQRPRSASPLVRGSPARMSIGPSSRGRTPYQHDIIHEEQCSEPPVMKRSFSLNSENLQHARQAANQINLRTSMSGCLESPTKRVSFSSLPNKQKDINGNGSQSAPNTPSRTPRPSSSDSVFLYSPGDAPDKPLPPVPEHQVCDHSHGVYSAPPTKPSGGFQVMLGSPTRWHNQDNNRAMQQHQRQHASPGSESGSEAGEVQRILFKQPQATYVSFKGRTIKYYARTRDDFLRK